MSTGENEQALRAVADFLRLASIVVLGLHLYIFCFAAFEIWGLTHPFATKFLIRIGHAPWIRATTMIKALCFVLMVLALMGVKGKKDVKSKPLVIGAFVILGLLFYWASPLLLKIDMPVEEVAWAYMVSTVGGYIMMVTGGVRISRIIKVELGKDLFNRENESFPQEERYVANEYSVNLPGRYFLRGKERRCWINNVSPFRSSLVIGSGGAGKSFFIVRHFITQMISKGYAMFLYDFKFPDLSIIAYNAMLKHQGAYKVPPKFYYLNFDDPSRTHRCNAIPPKSLNDIADAAESSRTLLLSLNRDWIKKSGEFFSESAINFVSALIWFMRNYEQGRYCTLPHVIELSNLPYDDLFPLLSLDSSLDSLINVYISAYCNRALEQLEGQVGSAKIALGRLVSPAIYYVLSGDDFSLDINNPDEPKIVCAGNNPKRVQTYGAVLSLYVTRMSKIIMEKGRTHSAIIVDELPTIFWNNVEILPSLARGYKIASLFAVQDYSQLKKDYSREQAEVLLHICGNLYCGQSVGETAKHVSERIGKIVQPRESVSINRQDTSVSKSTQLDAAVPPSRIAQLSSGEFVGLLADTPTDVLKYKVFHCDIINDHKAIASEEAAYKEIPPVRNVTQQEVMDNFQSIKDDIERIRNVEIERIKNDPQLSHLLFKYPEEPKK